MEKIAHFLYDKHISASRHTRPHSARGSFRDKGTNPFLCWWMGSLVPRYLFHILLWVISVSKMQNPNTLHLKFSTLSTASHILDLLICLLRKRCAYPVFVNTGWCDIEQILKIACGRRQHCGMVGKATTWHTRVPCGHQFKPQMLHLPCYCDWESSRRWP